jgi:Zn-dependent peptidase ImmA (M78 family)
MKNDDCPECAAFAAEISVAAKDMLKQANGIRSREEVQQILARYLSLPEEAILRLRESFSATKAGQIYARFIGASHHYRLH